MQGPALVTVVIPTVGRSSLRAAVESALCQQGVRVAVQVVADTDATDPRELGLSESADALVSIIFTGGGQGAAIARNLGTERADTPWVAYLDDDDVWLPIKLQRQLRAVEGCDPQLSVVSCQSSSFNTATGHERGPIPSAVYSGDQPLATWLFRRRRLSSSRALMPTPTLLLGRELAKEVGWRALPRHQDWDFLQRLSERPGVKIAQVDEILVRFAVGSPNSISSSSSWRMSLAWAEDYRDTWDPGTFVDFVYGQPLRYALQARDREGITTVLRAVKGRRPSARALALGLSGLLGRPTFDRLLHSGTGVQTAVK